MSPSPEEWEKFGKLAAQILTEMAEREQNAQADPDEVLASYLTAADVAQRIPGMTETRLAKHAYEGDGPFFTMVGRTRVYAWEDVKDWMRENRTRQTDRFKERQLRT